MCKDDAGYVSQLKQQRMLLHLQHIATVSVLISHITFLFSVVVVIISVVVTTIIRIILHSQPWFAFSYTPDAHYSIHLSALSM